MSPAARSLRNYESSALESPEDTSFYTGKGRPTRPKIKNLKGGKLAQKAGPTAIIITIILAVAAAFGIVALQPAHIQSVVTEQTDSGYANFVAQKAATSARYGQSKLKLGRAANYFDKSSGSWFSRIGATRNRLADYRQSDDAAADEADYNNRRNSIFAAGADADFNSAEDIEVENEDGEIEKQRVATGEKLSTKTAAGTDAKVKAASYLNTAASKIADAGGIGCAAAKVANMIAIAVLANNIYTNIQDFLTDGESMSKSMTEAATASAVNDTMNRYNETVTTTYLNPTTNEEEEVTGAMIESPTWRRILGDNSVTSKETYKYSAEAGFTSGATALAINGYNIKACSAVQTASSVVSVIASAIPGASFVKLSVGTLINAARSAAISTAVALILRGMIPFIATLFTNHAELIGIPEGEATADGAANLHNLLNKQASGLTPATKEKVQEYSQAQRLALAEEAKADREGKSPFDTSSNNTFLGSILAKLLPLSTSKTASTSLTSITNITNTSIASITGAYADGENTSFLTTYGDCPIVSDSLLNAAADLHCNPKMIADLSTVNITEDDPTYAALLAKNTYIDEKGNRQIKDNSDWAKYVILYLDRESPLFVTDAGIAEACTTNFGPINYIPFAGEVVDAINAVEEAACADIADGTRFVFSDDNPYWNTDIKYFQRFVSENRIKDQLYNNGDSDNNPVIALKERYYAKYPLDDTPSGYLARISGLSKQEAEDTLAIAYYLVFVSEYDPTTRLAFAESNPDFQKAFAEGREQPTSCSQNISRFQPNKCIFLTDPTGSSRLRDGSAGVAVYDIYSAEVVLGVRGRLLDAPRKEALVSLIPRKEALLV